MSPISSITVYCSSSRCVAGAYFDAAAQLGRAIAREGWTLVYGGNAVGTMGALADGARAAGGKVVGISPRLLFDKGIGDERCDELVLTDDMRTRKRLLEERGDAFVALPGGIGTFEEIFEVLVGRSLGYHRKPIVLVNLNGYFAPLLEMMSFGVREGFIRENAAGLWSVAAGVQEAVEYLKAWRGEVAAPSVRVESVPSAIE
jgi:uncharacterized protein (TIGR00730 family)